MSEYHSYDEVFRVPGGHALFLGDMQAAQDFDFLQQQQIRTGDLTLTQWSQPPATCRSWSSARRSDTSSTLCWTASSRTSPPSSATSTSWSSRVSPGAASSFTVQPVSPAYPSPQSVPHPRHLLPHAPRQSLLPRGHRLRSQEPTRSPAQPGLRTAAEAVRDPPAQNPPLAQFPTQPGEDLRVGEKPQFSQQCSAALDGQTQTGSAVREGNQDTASLQPGQYLWCDAEMQRESKKQLLLRRWGRGEGNRRDIARSLHEPEGERVVPAVRPVRRNLAERLRTLHETEFGPN